MSSTPKSDKPYTHWIHCNRCFEAFYKKEHKFFLLACRHIVCELCHVEMKQDIDKPPVCKCTVCHKITRSCEIGRSMPKNLKQLLHPEPYVDGLNFSLIHKFQSVHRRGYMEHLYRQENELEDMYQIAVQQKELCQNKMKELEQQQVNINQLKNKALSIKQQRRAVADNRPYKSVSLSSSSSCTSSIEPRNGGSSAANKSQKDSSFFPGLNPHMSFCL